MELGSQIEGQMVSPANPTNRRLLLVGGNRGERVCMCDPGEAASDGGGAELEQLIKQ